MKQAGTSAALEESPETAPPPRSVRGHDRRLRRMFVLALAGAFIALFLDNTRSRVE